MAMKSLHQNTVLQLVLLMLLTARFHFCSAAEVGRPVVAGRSGNALYFSAQRADKALIDFDDDTAALSDGLTVEVWIKRLDKHTVSTPFSMVSWDAEARASTRELSLIMVGEYGLWRTNNGGLVYNCPNTNCSFGFDYDHGWHHVAVSHSPISGAVKLYRDGALVSDSSAMQPPHLQRRPTRPGLVMLGQFMQSYGNTFDSDLSFDGVMDELRIWRSERTLEEIVGCMHHRLNPNDHARTLAMAYHFDELPGSEWAVDSTSGGQDVRIGRLLNPLNEAVFFAPKGTVTASSPRFVASEAPVYGGTVEAYVVRGGQVEIELSAWAGNETKLSTYILEAPTHGTVQTISASDGLVGKPISQGSVVVDPDTSRSQCKRVWYVPGPDFSETGDTFVYSVRDEAGNNASAEVRIWHLQADAPAPRTVTTLEDRNVILTLGGASVDSHQVANIVTSLPEFGALYDVGFNSYMNFFGAPNFSKYPDANLSDTSRPITRAMLPHTLLDEEGTVLYVPPPNQANFRDSFSFRHVLRRAIGPGQSPVVTPDAFAHVVVVPGNDSPEYVGETVVTAQPDARTPLQLRSIDIDGSFASATEWWVSKQPRLGSLSHYVEANSDDSTTEELLPMKFGEAGDTIIQWASELPPYDPEWGPSFSSQTHGCPSTCCDLQATCNPVDCAATGIHAWPCQASMLKYYAFNILGSSNHETKEGSGWLPSAQYSSQGPPFIVVGFAKELHFSSISVLERVSSQFPPAITRLSVASEYEGNATQWTVLWEGIPKKPSWLNDIEQMVEFKAPGICRKGARGRYLRIEAGLMQNSTHVLAGASMEGNNAMPRGLVASANDTVIYVPESGFHGISISCGANCTSHGAPFDAIEVQPSDCIDRGRASTVAIHVPPPSTVGIHSTAPSLAQRTPIIVGVEKEVRITLDGSHVAQLIAERYALEGEECNAEVFSRVAVLDDGGGRVIFTQVSDGAKIPMGGEPVSLTADGRTLRVTMDPERLYSGARLEVWTTVCGITARYIHSVELVCSDALSDDEVADPFVCALDPAICTDLGVRWNDDKRHCESPASATLAMVLGLGLGFGVLAALMCLAAAYLGLRNRKLSADLQKLRNAGHLDAESPLTMVLGFLADIGEGNKAVSRRNYRRVQERARELRDVLISSRSLYMPNLDNIADGPGGGMNEDMKRFLLESSAIRTSMERNSSTSSVTPSHVEVVYSVDLCATGHRAVDGSAVSADLLLIAQEEYEALKPELDAELGKNIFLDALSLDAKATSGRALEHVVVHVLDSWHVVDVLRISWSRLRGFMRVVVAGYQDNPYHGPAHALDVTCRLTTMLSMSGIAAELSGSRDGCVTLLALVLAAAIHDYKHPGTTNSWVVYKEMEPAMHFNDQAVLENLALHELLLLMREPGSFVSHLKAEHSRALRTQLIELVLATDMSRHFELMAAAQTKVVEALNLGNNGNRVGSKEEPHASGISKSFVKLSTEQQRIVLQIAMKAADLGHCLLPMKLHLPWLQRLEDEFFAQGDLERAESRPISPLMDRFKTGPMVGQNQLGFYSFITLPLYRVWSQMYPSGGAALYDQLHRNFEFFQENQGPLTMATVESASEPTAVVHLPGSANPCRPSWSSHDGALGASPGTGEQQLRRVNSEKKSLI